MGNCCGKGTKPLDPDKSPYLPTADGFPKKKAKQTLRDAEKSLSSEFIRKDTHEPFLEQHLHDREESKLLSKVTECSHISTKIDSQLNCKTKITDVKLEKSDIKVTKCDSSKAQKTSVVDVSVLTAQNREEGVSTSGNEVFGSEERCIPSSEPTDSSLTNIAVDLPLSEHISTSSSSKESQIISITPDEKKVNDIYGATEINNCSIHIDLNKTDKISLNTDGARDSSENGLHEPNMRHLIEKSESVVMISTGVATTGSEFDGDKKYETTQIWESVSEKLTIEEENAKLSIREKTKANKPSVVSCERQEEAANLSHLNSDDKKPSLESGSASSEKGIDEYPNNKTPEEDFSNYRPSTKVSQWLYVLPDLRGSNTTVTKRFQYCSNTRIPIIKTIDAWESATSFVESRILCIHAESGMGKSTLCKFICSKYEKKLAAFHFFNSNNANPLHNNFRHVLLWLVHCFLLKVEPFAKHLPDISVMQKLIDEGSVRDIIQNALFNPLQLIEENTPLLIVLDALDECNFNDRDDIYTFLNEFQRHGPKWLRLCVSFRKGCFQDISGNTAYVEIDNDDSNHVDMKRIMRPNLSRFMDKISLDCGLNELAKYTGGSPLCAAIYNRILSSSDSSQKMNMRDISVKYSASLNGVLSQIFSDFKQVNSLDCDENNRYVRLIGMLAQAREPLDLSFISDAGFVDIEKTLEQLHAVLELNDNKVTLLHSAIAEWLLAESNELGVPVSLAHRVAFDNCQSWVQNIVEQGPKATNTPLSDYAVKNLVAHVIEVPNQQEYLATALCNLHILRRKLCLVGIDVTLHDYEQFYQQPDTGKRVSMKAYMLKTSELEEKVQTYKHLLMLNYQHLKFSPVVLLHVAANYTKSSRIQQNARLELQHSTWLEDLTISEETRCVTQLFKDPIICSNIALDGKTVVCITKDKGEKIHLHKYNSATLDLLIPPTDISNIFEQALSSTMNHCYVLEDKGEIFIGSLDWLVAANGTIVQSNFEIHGLPVKEFRTEACAQSHRYLAIALTTFPFNGRTVHVALLDIIEKRCVKTIEVLTFRFGGNMRFGVKGLAISHDERFLGVCCKSSYKEELTIRVYDLLKEDWVSSYNLSSETCVKLDFCGTSTLFLTVSDSMKKYRTIAWNISDKVQIPLEEEGVESVISSNKTHIALFESNTFSGSTKCSLFNRCQSFQKQPICTYRFQSTIDEHKFFLHATGVLLCGHMELRAYDNADLQDDGTSLDNPTDIHLTDMRLESMCFVPRSESVLLNTFSKGDTTMLYSCDISSDEIHINNTLVNGMKPFMPPAKIFRGAASAHQGCHVSCDGSQIILSSSHQGIIWNRITGQTVFLPYPDNVTTEENILFILPSPKEPLVAIVFATNIIHVFNLVAMQYQGECKLDEHVVSDISFMPCNGYLLSYHRNVDSKVVVWNPRNCTQVSIETIEASFISICQTVDRFAVSWQGIAGTGLILWSTDGRPALEIIPGSSWPFEPEKCDAIFSPDGTVLVAVDSDTFTFRVWSSINGDYLKEGKLVFHEPPVSLCMPTNSHIAIWTSVITIVDIKTGENLAIATLPPNFRRSPVTLHNSHRGCSVAGVNTDGQCVLFRIHNLKNIRFKTALQHLTSNIG